MIKIKPRAHVDDSFISAHKIMLRQYLKELQERWQYLRPEQLHRKYKAVGAQLSLMRDIYHDVAEPGKGLDLFMTRLRALPYREFTAARYNGKAYLVGLTRTIIAQTYPKTRGMYWMNAGQYDIGPYSVYLPIDHLINSQISGVHLVPMRDPLTLNRHLHHVARPVSSSELSHPLDLSPSTCLGSFAVPLQTNARTLNVVELFRLFYLFLGRLDLKSPITRQSMHFMHHMTTEQDN